MRKWSGSARRWAREGIAKACGDPSAFVGYSSDIFGNHQGPGPFESHIHCGDIVVLFQRRCCGSRETPSNRAGIGFTMRWKKLLLHASPVPISKPSALHVQSPSPMLQGKFSPNIVFLPLHFISFFPKHVLCVIVFFSYIWKSSQSHNLVFTWILY